jgi:hypothetical protein
MPEDKQILHSVQNDVSGHPGDSSHPEQSEGSLDDSKIPWHFWIGVTLVGLYLVYRVIELVVMGFTNIF